MAPFVPRERKHRKRARTEEDSTAPSANSNTEVLLPREQRAAQLKQDLRAPDTKINAKKRKRLDKYVEGKLRKEENADLIAKIARQDVVDTSLLQSSKRLGRVGESKRERLQRALKEGDAGVDGGGEEVLFQRRKAAGRMPVSDEEGESAEEVDEDNAKALAPAPQIKEPDAGSGFGACLKQPLGVDAAGRPLIRKRKRRKKTSTQVPTMEALPEDKGSEGSSSVEPTGYSDIGSDSSSADDEDEWNGFSDAEDGLANRDSQTSSSNESASEEDEEDQEADTKPRISAFKQWADAQRNAASDFTPSAAPNVDATVKANFKPRALSPDPMLQATTNGTSTARPARAITITRAEDVQAARLELPVVQEEQKIMEAIHNNSISVVCGSTGSGKTTQVPQMLYENGYGSSVGTTSSSSGSDSLQSKGMIGITQPRRVAATSVADRVAHELGHTHGKKVAHQVRYDSSVSRGTAIKFLTDGILLREIQQDFALTKYSCIVVDEAHERSVNTDILIGLLSRIVPLRTAMSKEQPDKFCPLKLIVMSATLRVADFLGNKRLFKDGPPPIVEAEGRQFPVTVHLARRTRRDFMDETVEKVAKAHRRLPPGGMLVFLTGQQEIQTVVAGLRERLAGSQTNSARAANGADHESLPGRNGGHIEDEMDMAPSEDEDEATIETEEHNEFAIPTDASTTQTSDGAAQPKGHLKPQILPLYAALPASQQSLVFKTPPENHRHIILATNVAETSLTIPGIKYVFDCGRSKEKTYFSGGEGDGNGIQSFETSWISKASASQRTGRAGRTAPGHCWRLYSSAVFEEFFPEHSDPEVLRTPLESVVLQLKGFAVEKVANFPFPTPPDREQMLAAERLLLNLGAVVEDGTGLTKIGEELARLPVSPRFGKMLLQGRSSGTLEYIVALVAGLSVGELSVSEPQIAAEEECEDHEQEEQRRRHQAYTRAHRDLAKLDERSDAVKMLTAVVMHAESSSRKHDPGDNFSKQYFLRQKGMQEAQQLRQQLWNILSAATQGAGLGPFKPLLSPPKEAQLGAIRQAVASGFADHVAIRADLLPGGSVAFGRKPRRANEVAYRPLVPLVSAGGEDPTLEPSEREMARSVFVHASSVLNRLSMAGMPGYVVYSHLSRASGGATEAKVRKMRMHPLTAVGPKTIARMAEGTPLIEYGKPISSKLGGSGVGGVVEKDGGRKRECWVPVTIRSPGGAGETAWAPLDCWKVLQRKGKRGEWSIEKVLEYGR